MGKLKSTTLRNKIHIKHGFPFKGEFFATEGEYVVLTPGNFKESGGFKFDIDKAKFYCGEIPTDYICVKGDLIVAMTEQAEGLLGSSAIVPEDNRFLHNQRIGLVTVLENEAVDRSFLYHVFNTKSVRRQLRSGSSGSKVKHTSPDRIYDVIVNLPPLLAQQKSPPSSPPSTPKSNSTSASTPNWKRWPKRYMTTGSCSLISPMPQASPINPAAARWSGMKS